MNEPTWFAITGDQFVDGGLIGVVAGLLAAIAWAIVAKWIREWLT